jgi:hypothetical protein
LKALDGVDIGEPLLLGKLATGKGVWSATFKSEGLCIKYLLLPTEDKLVNGATRRFAGFPELVLLVS